MSSTKIVSEVEALLYKVTMAKKTQTEMLAGMIEHKNSIIGWIREQQKLAIEHTNAVFDGLADTLTKEVKLLEMAAQSLENPNE